MLWQVAVSVSQNSTLPPELSLVMEWFVKWALTILAIFYVMFAIMVVRQVTIMRQTLITSFSPILGILGLLHLALAVFVLIVFLFVL